MKTQAWVSNNAYGVTAKKICPAIVQLKQLSGLILKWLVTTLDLTCLG